MFFQMMEVIYNLSFYRAVNKAVLKINQKIAVPQDHKWYLLLVNFFTTGFV